MRTPDRPDKPPFKSSDKRRLDPHSPSKKALIIGGVVVVAVAIALSNNQGDGNGVPGTGGGDLGGSSTHSVTYKVTATGNPSYTYGSMTYQNSSNDTSQATDADIPWTDSEYLSDGDFYYISAQNGGGGTITCSVFVDGTEVDSNSSIGQYAICTASGTI
jgi:hypothetical protein